MTIHAYPEIYLNRAQIKLGDAFDYAINTCKIPGDEFIKLFTVSSISKRIENGEAAILAGMSGIEIAIEKLSGRQRNEQTILSRPYVTNVQWNIGSAGRLLTTSGIPEGNSMKFSRLFLLKSCPKFTIHSTKPIFLNLSISWIEKSGKFFQKQI